jgi:hypothetical protein
MRQLSLKLGLPPRQANQMLQHMPDSLLATEHIAAPLAKKLIQWVRAHANGSFLAVCIRLSRRSPALLWILYADKHRQKVSCFTFN